MNTPDSFNPSSLIADSKLCASVDFPCEDHSQALKGDRAALTTLQLFS